MGKKSLLSATSRKKGGGENGEEIEKKSKATTDSKKKAVQAASKKKTPTGAAAKNQASPKKKTTSMGVSTEETEQIQQLLIEKFDTTFSRAEPDPVPETLSGDMSSPAVSISGRDDNDSDASPYSSIEPEDSTPAKKMDSMHKTALIGIVGLVALLGLVMSASITNTAKYYLKPAKGELEVWKGTFSPMGKKKIVTLSATPMPAQPKDLYGKNEIFSFIFESYINQADALLNVSDMPDFELIKRTLNRAGAFAVSPELNESIQRRLSKINLLALVYKADILADKNTAADLASARDALEKAMRLTLDEAEKGLIKQKLQGVNERQAQLEQMETSAAKAESTGIDE